MDKYILSYDSENDALYVKILGVLETEDLNEVIAQYQRILEGKPHRHILVDMTESSQFDASVMTRQLRNTYRDLMKLMKTDKTAIFGASPGLRMAAKIASAIIGKSDVTKFFKTKDEAIAWLKGE